MRRALLLSILLFPVADAQGADLEIDLTDASGDVMAFTVPESSTDRPNADILNVSSRIVGDDLRLYVRVAGPPKAPDDSLEVRIWFKDSVNGSFDAVDMDLNGAREPDERLKTIVRRDRYENVTYLPSRYGLENGTLWILSFNASVIADATCFDPYVRTSSMPKPREGPQATDGIGPGTPTCVQGEEPEIEFPDVIVPSPHFPSPGPREEPPGSAPTPFPFAASLLVILACVGFWGRRR